MISQDLLPDQATSIEELHDPYLDIMLEFEEAARFLDLEEWIVQRLRHTEREVTVNLPLVRDNGRPATFTGLRVQHNCDRGPTLGGVRFTPDAHLGQLRASAMTRTWQTALLDLPFGGSAGAVVCNPQELSERELRLLCSGYARSLRGLTGPQRDILAPDTGANERTMSWMLASHRSGTGQLDFGAVSGKPVALHGWPPSQRARAHAIFLLLQLALAERHASMGTQRVAVQGFGNVGAGIARLLHEAGARIVAVADISGGLHNEHGLNIAALQAYAERNQVILGFPHAEAVCNADVLEAQCDILVAAAAERQLCANNAGRIRASLIVEAVNGVATRAAQNMLEDRALTLVPHILGTAGESLAWSAEWTQAVHGSIAALELDRVLKPRIEDAYHAVRAAARKHRTNLQKAAHLVAIEKVAAALRLQEG
jgi:glutamate dehydrogenase (NAD(P)+)